LEQCLSSLEQLKWLTNMLGYDYEIIYKKVKDNIVADALSCHYDGRRLTLIPLIPHPILAGRGRPRMAIGHLHISTHQQPSFRP
jgi:hypothetical protein